MCCLIFMGRNLGFANLRMSQLSVPICYRDTCFYLAYWACFVLRWGGFLSATSYASFCILFRRTAVRLYMLSDAILHWADISGCPYGLFILGRDIGLFSFWFILGRHIGLFSFWFILGRHIGLPLRCFMVEFCNH